MGPFAQSGLVFAARFPDDQAMVKVRKSKEPAKPTSPAASGPAGSEFEAEVGASYLLALLVGGEPRGMPATIIDTVAFQRGAEGHPLDDLVVRAHDASGNPAILEVQVKRTIAFTASDNVFASVVAQMVEASLRPEFWTSRHELAVATARTSRKIDGAYQDVLTWARQLGASDVFAARIARPGSANDDMRAFVAAFKKHLRESGSADDDEMVWKLLRRFQILIYDFAAPGSASAELARERAARALVPSHAGRAADLWTALTRLALGIAAAGGDRSRESLRADPELSGFRWAGEPRHLTALTALAEAGRAALADLRDQIGDASIGRPARIAQVHEALEQGRYVEIRGDAGVGKSGVLKHFAEQAATENGIIVLSPGRTEPRGWAALRAVLRFEGSARDLLVELAADGMAILFVDNLDLFTPEERPTVVDLVREAATVPRFSVVTTARRDFGSGKPDWLPDDALHRLGRAPPILIGELSDAEIGDIAAAAPTLAPLLAASHPAKDVTRNLYRLARLAGRAQDAPLLRTETDMVAEWWETADGPPDGRRERGRVLRSLAEQAVGNAVTFDVRDQPAGAVDSLINSETLRNYGDDRVGFRHDVLREWAMARLFAIDSAALRGLPLAQPAPAFLARGVELYARSLIEGAADEGAWAALLDSLSDGTAHGSWRRAVLLSLVRSEAAARVLRTAMPRLVAENGTLLNELIRTMMAVDVQPATALFEALPADIGPIPAGLTIPSGPSWFRLIAWLLAVADDLPAGSLPDIVDLFTRWMAGMLGWDAVTPRLLERMHRWLTEIETAQDGRVGERHALFGGALSSQQIRSMADELRHGIAIFANCVPASSAAYLRNARGRVRREDIGAAIHALSGSLPAAAPEEFAAFMESVLIPAEPSPRRRHDPYDMDFERPFTHFDSRFLPVSPAQGGFFSLLSAAPEIGRRHIRRLVDHALSSHECADEEPDFVDIELSDGVRRFQWLYTYMWSREAGAQYYAISSGLMALEAWAHQRIEAGDPVETVIASVVGAPGDVPACYLLIAVDLILSHWPALRGAAIPFLASPELIVLDRGRPSQESPDFPDIFGLKEIQKEPRGPVSVKSLSDRPSRGKSLYDILHTYTFSEQVEDRERLVALLRGAAERLGPHGPTANYSDPEFMVLHALNILDAANWQPVQVRLDDGSTREALQYVAPPAEAAQLAPHQAEAQERLLEVRVQQAASALLDNPSHASPEAVGVLVDWAMAQTYPAATQSDEGVRDVPAWSKSETMLDIAMIATRDGDPELRQRSRDWAHRIFDQRLDLPLDPASGALSRLKFNALAIVFAGRAFSLRDRREEEDYRKLLEVAAHESAAAAYGFTVSVQAIATVDDHLLRSVLRCALQARIGCDRDWGRDEDVYLARKAALRQEVDAAVRRELDWLMERGSEPGWPDLPLRNPPAKRGLRLPSGPPEPPRPRRRRRRRRDEFLQTQGAAKWLAAAKGGADETQRPWLRELIGRYRAWTSNANGAALDGDEVERLPSDWNDAYFRVAAACAPGLSAEQLDAFVLDLIVSLPGAAFLSTASRFIRAADIAYFDAQTIETDVAIHIRSRLAQALRENPTWTRFARDRGASVETYIGDTVSALFFHTYHFGLAPPAPYVFDHQLERVRPLLPVLQALATEAPTLLVASETLALLQVANGPEQLPFAVAAARAWAIARPDDTVFWVDYALGRQLCTWLETVRQADPSAFRTGAPLRADIDLILAALIRAGVAEAGSLEAQLTGS